MAIKLNEKQKKAAENTITGMANLSRNLVSVVNPNVNSTSTRDAARAYDASLATKPAAYAYGNQSALDSAYKAVKNQKPFKYNVDGDALYQQYKAAYEASGKKAMQDTIGQAAALTGGYASTYAQNAGQQAYNDYMTGLNDIIPDLYGAAYDRYNAQAQRNIDLLGIEQARADDDYARYNDAYNRWASENSTAYNRYIDAKNADESRRSTMRSTAQGLVEASVENGIMPSDSLILASGYDPNTVKGLVGQYAQQREDEKADKDYERTQKESETAYSRSQDAWEKCLQVLSTGAMPSKELRKEAGMDDKTAKQIQGYYIAKNDSSGSGRSGSSSSSSGSSPAGGDDSGDDDDDTTPKKKEEDAKKNPVYVPSVTMLTKDEFMRRASNGGYAYNGNTFTNYNDYVDFRVREFYDSGAITADEADELEKYYKNN